jgi:hypothetical protein
MLLPEGYGFISGRSRATALSVLAAADEAGVDQVLVRAVAGGYQVPEAVLDEYNRHLGEEDKAIDSDGDAPEVVAAPADGTEITPENAGVITKSDGTVEVGTITPEAASSEDKADTAGDAQKPAVQEPKRSASRADWIIFASTLPNWDKADGEEEGLARNGLVEKYGTK